MLRLVATHHILRFMTSSLEVNYHDSSTRFSRETPEGQARFMKLQQCSHTLKNVAAVPFHDIFSILTTYSPVLPELAALHGQSMSDAINHPALALLHRDVSELLAGALDLAAKPNAHPSNLQSDMQALVKRKLRMRPSTSSSTNGSSPAVAMAANAAGGSGTAGVDPAAAAAAPVAAEPEAANRSMSSPPPASSSSTASSTMRDDSPEFVSACLRCATCAAMQRSTAVRPVLTPPSGSSLSTDLTAASSTGVLSPRCLPYSSASPPALVQVLVHRQGVTRRFVFAEVASNAAEQSAVGNLTPIFLACLLRCFCAVRVCFTEHKCNTFRGGCALLAPAKTTPMCVVK